MKLESDGMLIALKPINERDVIARVFTRDYGVMVGVMRGAIVAKKNKPMVGQFGAAVWNARVDSQLGVFHWEIEKNITALLMNNQRELLQLNAAFELLATLLPEREEYTKLFADTCELIDGLVRQLPDAYLKWEINLLGELGYALDLSRCSGCGTNINLNYLSPKTGRAVCDKCAAPYINRVYKLPLNLDVTGKFLYNVYAQQGGTVPQARLMLNFI